MTPSILSFLEWMRRSNEWAQINDSWANSSGPWSLPLALSRAYFRYRESQVSDKNVTRSHSGTRAYLELPPPAHSQDPLSGAILDAFGSLTQSLPEQVRLPYQLHLEGLLDGEIAGVLSRNQKEVSDAIKVAKDLLLSGFPRRRAS